MIPRGSGNDGGRRLVEGFGYDVNEDDPPAPREPEGERWYCVCTDPGKDLTADIETPSLAFWCSPLRSGNLPPLCAATSTVLSDVDFPTVSSHSLDDTSLPASIAQIQLD
jgi:hypothetical protein